MHLHHTYLLAEKKKNYNENEKDNSAIEMRTEIPSRKGIDGTPTIMMGEMGVLFGIVVSSKLDFVIGAASRTREKHRD